MVSWDLVLGERPQVTIPFIPEFQDCKPLSQPTNESRSHRVKVFFRLSRLWAYFERTPYDATKYRMFSFSVMFSRRETNIILQVWLCLWLWLARALPSWRSLIIPQLGIPKWAGPAGLKTIRLYLGDLVSSWTFDHSRIMQNWQTLCKSRPLKAHRDLWHPAKDVWMFGERMTRPAAPALLISQTTFKVWQPNLSQSSNPSQPSTLPFPTSSVALWPGFHVDLGHHFQPPHLWWWQAKTSRARASSEMWFNQ